MGENASNGPRKLMTAAHLNPLSANSVLAKGPSEESSMIQMLAFRHMALEWAERYALVTGFSASASIQRAAIPNSHPDKDSKDA